MGQIPLGGKFINTILLVQTPKCINDQKQEKKTIISDSKNILNPKIIFSWAKIVIPPELDSFCKSFIQDNVKYNNNNKLIVINIDGTVETEKVCSSIAGKVPRTLHNNIIYK
jgi:hypothetical protein